MLCAAIKLIGVEPALGAAYAAVVSHFSRVLGYDTCSGGLVANGVLSHAALAAALIAAANAGVKASYTEQPIPPEAVPAVPVEPEPEADVFIDANNPSFLGMLPPLLPGEEEASAFKIQLSGVAPAQLVQEGGKVIAVLSGHAAFSEPPTGWEGQTWCIYGVGTLPVLPEVACTLQIVKL